MAGLGLGPATQVLCLDPSWVLCLLYGADVTVVHADRERLERARQRYWAYFLM